MKNELLAAVAAMGMSFASSAAAAVIDYSALINLAPTPFTTEQLNAPLSGGPIAIEVGYMLQGTITFANGGRVTIYDNPAFRNVEGILASFRPDYNMTAYSVGTYEFLGVTGDYVGPRTLVSGPSSGAIAVWRALNLTDTAFSFTGIRFSITYVSDPHTPSDLPLTKHVTPSYFRMPLGYYSISEGAAVPEPATWATLTVGFGVLGGALRRRRATSEQPISA